MHIKCLRMLLITKPCPPVYLKGNNHNFVLLNSTFYDKLDTKIDTFIFIYITPYQKTASEQQSHNCLVNETIS